MTENKRFIFVGSGIEDNLTQESYLYNKDGFQDVCDVLNNLYEEKETLLHIIDWCLTHHREVEYIVFNSRDEFFIWLKEKGVLK